MRPKQVIGLVLTIVMVAAVFTPAVSAADSAGIGLDATIKEPKPEIAITVDVESIDFGELLPGETSASYPVSVTNIGLKTLDVTADVEDDGSEAIFVAGITVNGGVWSEYSSQLASDDSDSFDVAFQIPETATTRGDISGSLTVWAEEHASGPIVLFDGTVELTAGGTFDYVTPGGASYPGLVEDNDMGALFHTGLDFYASDAWYPYWMLESIEGIANEPWSEDFHFWVVYINDELAGNGQLPTATVVDGDNVKFYYLQYDTETWMPRVDGALYLVNIDVVVNTIAPEADFSAYGQSGDVPLITHFVDRSLYKPTSWLWNFGDGNSSTERAPAHTYETPGVYTVTLTVTNSAGSDTVTKEGFITANAVGPGPTANFGVSAASGNFPLTVEFYDQSTNSPTSWAWDFDNDGTVDSTEQNPSYTYEVAGTYSVKLTVTNAYGSDEIVYTNLIYVLIPYPDAAFSAAGRVGAAPLTVQFTDESTNSPTSWAWDFDNDGNVDSTEQNPSYTYEVAGTYSVKLTVTNAYGSDDEIKVDYVLATESVGEQQEWTEFQGGPYHDGVTANRAPVSSAAEVWSAQVSTTGNSGIDVAPIIADGKVFVIDNLGHVYAYYVDNGTLAWSNQNLLGTNSTSFQVSTPAYHDGVLYVALINSMASGTNGASAFALDATDGTVIWSKVRFVTGYCQPNTPVVYDEGRVYFGIWYSSGGPGKYYCLNAENGTTAWERPAPSGSGYYWAGAAIIGNYLVYGDDLGRIVSLYKNNGTVVQEVTVNGVFGTANREIRSSVSYSEETERIYFTTKEAYCFALGFDRDSGTFNTGDKWATYLGTHSTSTPAVYGGKVYVGSGDFQSNSPNTLYCLNETDGSVLWTFEANNGIQASPVVSTYFDDGDGEVYIYFTTNAGNGRAYCVDGDGQEMWSYEPDAEHVQNILQGVALYDGKVFFGNDAGYLFALGGV